ncbi:MAG: hypothetical protein LDL33_08135 [Desulfomonile sp.]|nr:hypothetical protein [Desulfomonile sp.]
MNPSSSVARVASPFLDRPAVGEVGLGSCHGPSRRRVVGDAALMTKAGARPGDRVEMCASPSIVRVVSHFVSSAVIPVPVTDSPSFQLYKLTLPLNYSRKNEFLPLSQGLTGPTIPDKMPRRATRRTVKRELRRQFPTEKK